MGMRGLREKLFEQCQPNLLGANARTIITAEENLDACS